MDVLSWIPELSPGAQLGIAFLATCMLYFAFKKRDEFSRHATANTLATLVVTFANLGALWLFVNDVNLFAQGLYRGLGIPTVDPAIWDGVPFIVICVVGLVAKDFADYCSHRVMHTKWGWPTHAAHHSDTFVNAFSVWRVHFLEVIVMSASYIILLTWMQIPEAIPAVATFHMLHGIYIHMDLPFQHGPLKYLIASPVYHRWHHADVPEAHGKNLANLIPIWDVMFGTYYSPGICDKPMGALESGIEDKNPFLIYIYPFQEWARLIGIELRRLSRFWRTRSERPAPSATHLESAEQKR